MDSTRQDRLISVIVIIAIVAISAWVYIAQFKSAWNNGLLNRHIGEVLAERTANTLGPRGQIVLISVKGFPQIQIQKRAFKAKLKQLGQYELREESVDAHELPKFRMGSGFPGEVYFRTVKKNARADLFVSFIGAPKLTPGDITELGTKSKLVVGLSSLDDLTLLFEKDLAVAGFVSQHQRRSHGSGKPSNGEEWFDRHYQIVTGEGFHDVPREE